MKKKKILTRKGRAIRWLLAAAGMAVLVWTLLPWQLTPEAALRRELENRQTGEMELVYQTVSTLERPVLLVMNDHVMAGAACKKYNLLQWNCTELDIVEREAGRPFAAGTFREWVYDHDPDKCADYHYVFGVLQDDTVTELRIVFDAAEGGFDQTVRLTEKDWIITESGERLFFCALREEMGLFSWSCSVTGYRADGTATETRQVADMPRWE